MVNKISRLVGELKVKYDCRIYPTDQSIASERKLVFAISKYKPGPVTYLPFKYKRWMLILER